jgi:hypothetical protein
MALGCEPGSRKHAPLPGHLKTGYSNGSGLIVIYIIKALNGISYLTIKKRGGTGMHIYIYISGFDSRATPGVFYTYSKNLPVVSALKNYYNVSRAF